jgi:NADH:ubiquinone oxidoreductase subunit 6 (subunit J)
LNLLFWLFHEGAVWVFGAAAIGGALAVVISQNVARMAFWLIVSLGATAGLFFSLDADFVGATQLLIYVGGTLVLLIFGVMLTASGPYLAIKTRPGEMVLAGVVGLLLMSLIAYSALGVNWAEIDAGRQANSAAQGFNPAEMGNTTRGLGLKFLGGSAADVGSGRTKLSPGYLLPFEIVSVHLLVVLIGAAYLARAKRRRVTLAPASDSGARETGG